MRKLFKNAKVIDKDSERFEDILVENGKIVEISADIPLYPDTHIINLVGMTLMPGFIDMHAHLRTPGFPLKETFETRSEERSCRERV